MSPVVVLLLLSCDNLDGSWSGDWVCQVDVDGDFEKVDVRASVALTQASKYSVVGQVALDGELDVPDGPDEQVDQSDPVRLEMTAFGGSQPLIVQFLSDENCAWTTDGELDEECEDAVVTVEGWFWDSRDFIVVDTDVCVGELAR